MTGGDCQFEDLATRRMHFVSRIRGSRDVHELSVVDFNQLVRTRKGSAGFTLQEHFNGGTNVVPYFDWDAKYPSEPTADEVAKQFSDFKGCLSLVCGFQPGDLGKEPLFASRHGTIVKDSGVQWKVSFRAWLPEFRCLVTDIPILARAALSKDPTRDFTSLDLSVYKAREQLLGCVGGCKDIDKEKRFLVPIDIEGNLIPWEKVQPADYLAQNVRPEARDIPRDHLQGSWILPSAKKKRSGKGKASAQGGAVDDDEGKGGDGKDEKEVFTATSSAEAKAALAASSDFFGFRFRMQEELEKITVNRTERWLILPTKAHWCYISKKTHAGNNPYICITEAGARFKCPDDLCRDTDLPHIPLAELPAPLRDFFMQTCFDHVDSDLMSEAKIECKRNIMENFPMEDGEDTSPLNDMLTTIAKHQKCGKCRSMKMRFEHSLKGWHLRCTECGNPWPTHPITLPQSHFPSLIAVLTQLNVSIGNLTVNNNYGATVDEPFVGTYEADGLLIFDDPEMNAVFLTALQGTDAALSELVFMLFREEFHCCKSGAKGTEGAWYQYKLHRWVPKAELTLRKLLGKEHAFLKYFRAALNYYERECVQTEETKRKARHIKKVCEQLGDGGRRKRILEDAIELFHEYRPNFAEMLDTGNKLVFLNGVYDLDTFEFREGKPEDMLSIQLKVPYAPVDEESAEYKYVMDFMEAIQPNEATRNYLLTLLSLCISTDSRLQLFWILTGGGANGKSKLMNLLMESLGDHFGTAPAALLTRRREDANQANESLSALEKVRVAVFSEGSSSEVLQISTIKLFSGEDTISTRGLHEKQRRWRPCFKCMLVCNDIPTLDEMTWAAWRRLKVVDFPTSFVDNPVRPHERQKDPTVGERLSTCTAAFLSILITYFKKYKVRGLIEPPSVTAATQKYQTDNDVFAEFKEEHISEEKGRVLPWTEIHEVFETWAKRKGRRVPNSKAAVKALFEKNLDGKPDRHWDKFKSLTVIGWKDLYVITRS